MRHNIVLKPVLKGKKERTQEGQREKEGGKDRNK
jgi:hypothetical protein